jgi:hypothetical protein
MVCGRCGAPLQGVSRGGRVGRRGGGWLLGLLTMIAISAGLASLDSRPQLPMLQPGSSGSGQR